MARTVVVGVEGTDSSHDALVWAAQAAQARGAVLQVVHAVGYAATDWELDYDDAVEQAARTLLEKEVARAEAAAPGLSVTGAVDHQSPGRALTSRSARAELLVVGTHRLSVAERLFSGSLAYQVAAGAECPVAVVPTVTTRPIDRVVVGADGSRDSLEAIRVAAREADRLGCELHVVHAWEQPAVYVNVGYMAGGFDESIQEHARVVLGESVAGLGETYPDLTVEQVLVQDQPATALLERAQDARLVVVGSRGLHGVARMLLGSVSHSVILHARCPVLVVRG